jgi:hypothetical protein
VTAAALAVGGGHVVASGFEQVPAPFALHLSGELHELVMQHEPSTQLPDTH